MRGFITIGICTLAIAAGCNEKSNKGKRGNGDATYPYQTTPSTNYPSSSTPSYSMLSGRNCTSKELLGSKSRRIIITAQYGVQQPSQMQIINSDGSSHTYDLQPKKTNLLKALFDTYEVYHSSGVYNQGSTYNNNYYGSSSTGSIYSNSNSGLSGGSVGTVWVNKSGTISLWGVEYTDSSSGTATIEKITAKAECS